MATTGPDGKVTIGLAPGMYMVQVSAPGYKMQAQPVEVKPGETHEMFFRLVALDGTVSVSVVDDRTGTAIAGATVEFTPVG